MPSMFARGRRSSAAAVSRIIRQLLDKGLASVSVSQDDGRQRRYVLTAKGRRTLDALRASRGHAIEAVWLQLDPKGLAAFTRFSADLVAPPRGLRRTGTLGDTHGTDALRQGLRSAHRPPAAVGAVSAADGTAPHPRGHVAAGVLHAARARASACCSRSAPSPRSTTSSRRTTSAARCVDPLAEEMLQHLERNCAEFGIRFFAPAKGEQGIVHVIGPEQGLTQPGMTICCGDSHTVHPRRVRRASRSASAPRRCATCWRRRPWRWRSSRSAASR